MTWFEINAAISYENEYNADPSKPRELTDEEVANIDREFAAEEERMY